MAVHGSITQNNMTLTERLRIFCKYLYQQFFSLAVASTSLFIVESFSNNACFYYSFRFGRVPCKRESRIVGTEFFLQFLILMKNTGECNASPLSPLRHTAMPSLFRCQLPYTQAICASCLRKLWSCLHLSSDFSFPKV